MNKIYPKAHPMAHESDSRRFAFIDHALNGSGPFRPQVIYNADGRAVDWSNTYLVRYPRESDEKFARRNELAFFASPLSRVTSRFVAHIAYKPVDRDIRNEIYKAIYHNADGKNNSIDVMWHEFMVNAKARGSMLLLVDMPRQTASSLQEQIERRVAPYWTPIKPEQLTDYAMQSDGRFEYVEFDGCFTEDSGKNIPCLWHFDTDEWRAENSDGITIESGEHGLGMCPMLAFTESGDYPCFGPFAPVADLSKRIFNLDSELDEILRSQTFSLLTMQVPEGSSNSDRIEAAKAVGETIGTQNLLMHSGSTPSFIAPDSGPASVYMERIQSLLQQIQDIGLEVSQTNFPESGFARQMRFHTINAELAKFSSRMEDFERQAWELTAKWLNLTETPDISWSRDFNIADTDNELNVLREMQETAMSDEVILAQQERVVVTQFSSMELEDLEQLTGSLSYERSSMVEPVDNG